jgi:ribosomal-protein-alanine N-acetyltransferase
MSSPEARLACDRADDAFSTDDTPERALVFTRNFEIRLGSQRDAVQIAEMSRQLIEVGLGWTWTPPRILRSLQDRDTNVAVAHDHGRIIGFGITHYRLNEAHIALLAVERASRRRGVGTALIRWIEATALTAGIGVVYLEARQSNVGARAFYRQLGYREVRLEPGMYRGIEAGVSLARDLWS